jgi:hypothetical protein
MSRLPLRPLGDILAWVYSAFAAGGGVLLLLEKGPWPLTNGWFALASGLAACPLTAWGIHRVVGVSPSGWVRFCAALFFWVAGRIALLIGSA